MKRNTLLPLLIASALTGGVINTHAATLWTGSDGGGLAGRMTRGGNWDNGTPGTGNDGSILGGSNLNIIRTNGIIQFGTATITIDNAAAVVTATTGGGTTPDVARVLAGTTIVLNSGTFNSTDLNPEVGTFTVNGGTVNASSLEAFTNSGFLNINGGVIDSTSLRGSNNNIANFTVSGGTVNADDLLINSGTGFTLSGGDVDIAAANTWDGTINFTLSSTASLTLTGYNFAAYETEFNQNDLIFDGIENNAGLTFSDYFQVSGSTLTTITAVPEPTAFAIMGLASAALVVLRRRRNRH